ncbi:DNA replication/checkpoint protein [Lineolata rhizophorae]|uniref:DNA replication regulator SLD2 n=1 Tax=Lineolata rhizophorae TaxID=578093 RepID=A0A6A6P1C0_9PEZI|nr:DNA replication/checkpoint protein [Lineolata rhizophorae]
MASHDPKLLERSAQLRQELKAWEKQFAASHYGRRAGRSDIKANPAIAAKYKEYNSVRAALEKGKAPPPESRPSTALSPTPSKKRKSQEYAAGSEPPRKRASSLSTPTKKRKSREGATNQETPRKRASPSLPPEKGVPAVEGKEEDDGIRPLPFQFSRRTVFTPSGKHMMVGPTPQRNGQALGIFDLLSPETPTKSTKRSALVDISANSVSTPVKGGKTLDDAAFASGGRAKWSRTPMSEGRRFFLNMFATPPKKEEEKSSHDTPTSSRHSSTPLFLRRDRGGIMNTIDEEQPSTPRPRLPWKRRPFGRTLSSMIREMREQEEENRLNEEMEILREIEQENEGANIKETKAKEPKAPKVLVEDSQNMPLGPDGGNILDEELEEQDKHDARPAKKWKKKGAKRQTRRVILRPVTNRSKPPEPVHTSESESDHETAARETEIPIPDVQVNEVDETNDERTRGRTIDDQTDSDHSDFEASSRKAASKFKKTSKKNASKKNAPKEPKKLARKVKAEAHANYRKLKIKNKNSRANGKGKFRGR